jgi:hypothetical protein
LFTHFFVFVVLYGDITSSRPIRGNVTDGYNISAEMISPQYLYQTVDRRILFSDVKSCGRQIQIDTGLVSTVHGMSSLLGMTRYLEYDRVNDKFYNTVLITLGEALLWKGYQIVVCIVC